MFALMSGVGAATYVPVVPQTNRFSALTLMVKSIAQEVCFVYGIGMVLIGLYKFKANRECPVTNPVGRVMSTVFAGLALIGVSFLSVPQVV